MGVYSEFQESKFKFVITSDLQCGNSMNMHLLTIEMTGFGEMEEQLRVDPAFAHDSDLVPSAHFRQLIIIFSSSSRGPDVSTYTPGIYPSHTYA